MAGRGVDGHRRGDSAAVAITPEPTVKLDAARLMSEKFSFELPSKGHEPHLVHLERGVNVRGTVITGGGVVLDRLAADALEASLVRWTIAGKTLTLGPVALKGVEVDMVIHKGKRTIGTIKIAELTSGGTSVALGADREVTIARLEGRQLRLTLGEDGVRLAAGKLDVVGVDGRLMQVLPDNSAKTYDQLKQTSDDATEAAAVPGVSGDRMLGPQIDWRFLDALHGNIALDLSVDLAVPVIGSFERNYEIEIPIEGGIVDFKKLERQLGAIEDAIIDFEVEDGRLILEKDIPLMPSKTLLYWPLGPEEQRLAKDDKIRLSTLMRPMKPANTPAELTKAADDAREKFADAWKDRSGSGPPEPKSFRLLGVDIGAADIQLSFGTPSGTPREGRKGNIDASGRLSLHGGLRYRAEGSAPDEPALQLGLEAVRVATEGITIGPGKVMSGTMRVDIEALLVGIVGAAPQSIIAKTERITLGEIALFWPH